MSDGTFARSLLLKVYGFAWTLARPVLQHNKRLREGFSWRLVPEDWAGLQVASPLGQATRKNTVPAPTIPAHVDVWIQAASGGEAYLVWELLKRLPEALADSAAQHDKPLRVLVTTWTRQGLEVLHGMAATLGKEHPELSIHITFFPLDAPRIMARALDQARPRVVVLLETELWPGLMLGCARRNIPVLVQNGRMTDKSLHGYRLLDGCAHGFWQSVAPARVAAVSSADAARFAELFGAERVTIVPNIKFDRALPAAPCVAPTEASPIGTSLLPATLHHGRTVLFASAREEEEEVLIATIRLLRAKTPAPTILVAPRHMHRVDAWRKKLAKAGLPALFRSEWKTETEGHTEAAPALAPIPAGSLVLWDRFGELNSLYLLADAVFVGGSLAPLGGQNFLEPLALGKIPCCGPHLENFAWALQSTTGDEPGASDALEALGLLRRCRTAKTLAHLLQDALEHPVDPATVRQRFTAWLTPRVGGSLHCAKQIATALKE